MSYRTRVEAAILTGTPPLSAVRWALRAGPGRRAPREADTRPQRAAWSPLGTASKR